MNKEKQNLFIFLVAHGHFNFPDSYTNRPPSQSIIDSNFLTF